jgi:glycosyltransferase involved in cell wall biosynthesis
MKILLINDVGAPHGGAEMLTLSLRAGLRERGHDARIFASSAPSEVGPSEADYSCFGTTSHLRTLNRVANPSAPFRLRRVLASFRPDVVHVRMFLSQLSPLILPLLRDVPTLYHATWYESICPTGLKLLPDRSICEHRAGVVCLRTGCLSLRAWGPLMLQLRLARRWLSAFDLIVANSESMRRRLLADGIGPVEVVWNGVPVVRARPPLADPPTVTYAGRLGPEKGVDTLVRAFASVVARIPEARLLIAGSGPEEASLRRLIGELRLESAVRLLGHLGHDALEASLASGWVHAVPSLCEEPFGATAAEAMMRGTAVVGSRTGGLAELIVDDDTGVLVPPGDLAGLRDALLRVVANRELAERMGGRARQRALASMTRDRWIDRLFALYLRLEGRDGGVAAR